MRPRFAPLSLLLLVPVLGLLGCAHARVQSSAPLHPERSDGMRQLSDARLVERAQLLSKMLDAASPSTCDAFARGRMNSDDWQTMLGVLAPADQTAWAGLSSEAAAKPASPAPRLNHSDLEEVKTAMIGLLKALPEKEAARYLGNTGLRSPNPCGDPRAGFYASCVMEMITTALGDIGEGLPERMETFAKGDACWNVRTLYSLISRASGEPQATLARALVEMPSLAWRFEPGAGRN